jgi:hypothetical protein
VSNLLNIARHVSAVLLEAVSKLKKGWPGLDRREAPALISRGFGCASSPGHPHQQLGLKLLLVAVGIFGTALLATAAEPKEQASDNKQQQEKDRAESLYNLKQIGLAMLNYCATHKSYPPAVYSALQNPANGPVKPFLSWRVLILPFIDERDLYNQFKLDEPWDSDNNKKLIEKMPAIYAAPGSKVVSEFKTVYLTPRGKNTAFPGEKPTRIRDITDGTSKTIMVVEAADEKAVVWTKPDDYEIDEKNPSAGLVGLRPGEFLSVFCDGATRIIPQNVAPRIVKLLFDRNDGQVIDPAVFAAVAPVAVQPPPQNVPADLPVRPVPQVNQAMNQLKQIALAMRTFESVTSMFPSAYAAGNDGKPLLSWRVALLPFLGESELVAQFKLDEPWDSDNNKKLITKMPAVYKAPGSKVATDFKTVYLTVRGDKTPFPGARPVQLSSITDGLAQTIMVVEASDDKAVIWTKPDDFEPDEKNPVAGLVGLRAGGFLAAFCDGHIEALSGDIDLENLRGLFTRNGGEPINGMAANHVKRRAAAPAK